MLLAIILLAVATIVTGATIAKTPGYVVLALGVVALLVAAGVHFHSF